jgi:Glycosyl hydrolase family 81 C-terminal domain
MGHLNATFVKQYKTQVDSLLYDIAYVGNTDSSIVDDGIFFPFTRYKSWYDGHSFAAGLFQQGNGKSQESTSEAINGYYGAYLWTLVKSNLLETDVSVEVRDFMRLLLATEIRGTKTYWQMMPPRMDQNVSKQDATPQRYDESFTHNYMVGNLGMLDAVCSTYFAKELFYVHLINVIPVTAITAEVFDKDYVTEQYKNVIAVAEIPSAWQGYAVCNEAMSDPNIAWGKAVTMLSSQMDSGLSKSQVLYFISSLPDFQPPDDVFDATSASSNDNSGLSSSCESHSKCTGLIGLCCPTSAGNFLDCCNTSPELVDNHQNVLPLSGDSFSSDNASCDSHTQCSGLLGDCCPTRGGKFLECCDVSK